MKRSMKRVSGAVSALERHVLHAVGVRQRCHVVPGHRPEGTGERRETERAAGLGFTCGPSCSRSACSCGCATPASCSAEPFAPSCSPSMSDLP